MKRFLIMLLFLLGITACGNNTYTESETEKTDVRHEEATTENEDIQQDIDTEAFNGNDIQETETDVYRGQYLGITYSEFVDGLNYDYNSNNIDISFDDMELNDDNGVFSSYYKAVPPNIGCVFNKVNSTDELHSIVISSYKPSDEMEMLTFILLCTLCMRRIDTSLDYETSRDMVIDMMDEIPNSNENYSQKVKNGILYMVKMSTDGVSLGIGKSQ